MNTSELELKMLDAISPFFERNCPEAWVALNNLNKIAQNVFENWMRLKESNDSTYKIDKLTIGEY